MLSSGLCSTHSFIYIIGSRHPVKETRSNHHLEHECTTQLIPFLPHEEKSNECLHLDLEVETMLPGSTPLSRDIHYYVREFVIAEQIFSQEHWDQKYTHERAL